MATPWSKTVKGAGHTFRKFQDGDQAWHSWEVQIFKEDASHKCPTYVLRTPPRQTHPTHTLFPFTTLFRSRKSVV